MADRFLDSTIYFLQCTYVLDSNHNLTCTGHYKKNFTHFKTISDPKFQTSQVLVYFSMWHGNAHFFAIIIVLQVVFICFNSIY